MLDNSIHSKQSLDQTNNNKEPYELWNKRSTSLRHFKIIKINSHIKRDEDNLGKFDSIFDEDIFLRYSMSSKEDIYYNKRLKRDVESENVGVDKTV